MTKKEGLKIKIIDLLLNWKIWILFFFLIFSVVWFNYDFGYQEGIVISSVAIGGQAEKLGFEIEQNSNLRNLERIISLDGKEVKTEEEFFNILDEINKSEFKIKTNKKTYTISNFLNITTNTTNAQILGLGFREAPKSNLKLGIELEGGTKLILKAKNLSLSTQEFDDLINIITQRLSKGGLSGTKVKKIEDAFSEEKYILVESTSSNKNQIFDLMKRQGIFEATINDVVVFSGQNVVGIGPNTFSSNRAPCKENDNGEWLCSYTFSLTLDDEGADGFFNQTSQLEVIDTGLAKNIHFTLDNIEIVNLSMASSFKFARETTAYITISGDKKSTQKSALTSAKKETDKIKLILQTGPLPSELEVVSTYSVSSSLSSEFLSNSILVGLVSLLVVSLIVSIRYQRPVVFVGIVIALVSEIVIIFGISSLLSWAITIDLASIGGLIASIGTGVDDQIIINDEYFRKTKKHKTSKTKIRNALIIIMVAYMTTIAAMLPLSFAGLELIKGFSTMIVLGVTIGVFITRPAYAAFLRILTTTRKKREEEDSE